MNFARFISKKISAGKAKGRIKTAGVLLAAAVLLLNGSSRRVEAALLPLRAESCDSSKFLRDVAIPDGTQLQPGQTFIKKWEALNSGSCGWNKRYSLQFAGGERMAGEAVFLNKWIPPGGSVVLSAEMVAPQAEGTYEGRWILTDEEGTPFGTYFTVRVVVKKKTP